MKLPEKQNESQADKGSQHIPQHVTARGDNVTVHPPHHKKRPSCHSNLKHMLSHSNKTSTWYLDICLIAEPLYEALQFCDQLIFNQNQFIIIYQNVSCPQSTVQQCL